MDRNKMERIMDSLIELRQVFSMTLVEPFVLDEISSLVNAISPDIAAAVGTDDSDIIARTIQKLMDSESARQHFFCNPDAEKPCYFLKAFACKK